MKNLFEPERVAEVKGRIATLSAGSERQWGKMNAAQAVAHCAAGVELALGERKPPRLLIGRLIGGVIKPMALRDDAPMRRNSPTVQGLVILDERDLDAERLRLYAMIDRFAASGPGGCTGPPPTVFVGL
jgi:hypothetical protein